MAIEITGERLHGAVARLAALTGEKDFVVIGRGTLCVTAPAELRSSFAVTEDVDMWPRHNEAAALDECIELYGIDSEFYLTEGFYIERVGSWTLMTQPAGWEERATVLEVDGSKALVLGLYDLIYNKLEANREKDHVFIRKGLKEGLIELGRLESFICEFAPTSRTRDLLFANLRAILGS